VSNIQIFTKKNLPTVVIIANDELDKFGHYLSFALHFVIQPFECNRNIGEMLLFQLQNLMVSGWLAADMSAWLAV